jgi:prepilin-type N-terminal cleavage/methylation domain-containing protein
MPELANVMKHLLCLLTLKGPRNIPTAQRGFTLPELLVASLIAALVAAITAQVMISQLLEGRRLEVAQRLREDVSRLNYLVQIEGSEAESIEYNSPFEGCDTAGVNSFTFVVPQDDGAYASSTNVSRVIYYNADDADSDDDVSIWRCGPPVTRNGVLRHGETNVAGPVIRNAQLELNPDGCSAASSQRSVLFRVVPPVGLVGANLGDLGGCVTAHARSVFVCNPPLGFGGEIGDCP